MLYERWRAIARDRHDLAAYHDLATGRSWSFKQLGDALEAKSPAYAPIACVSGRGLDFVLEVLRAWRDGTVCCPLEAGQVPPTWDQPPRGICHIKLTSGTTGAPKGVAFTASQLAADARNIVATMGLRADWPNLGVISLAHSYGFSNLVLPLLLHGIPLIGADNPLPQTLLRARKLFPSLTLAAVPILWRTWLKTEVLGPEVKLAISAGAPLSMDLEGAIHARFGIKVHNFYGSTECGGIAYDRSSEPRTAPDLAGTALDGVGLSLSDDNRLIVQGDAVGSGYYPSSSHELEKGSFTSNDLAEINGGEIYLRGRASELLNIAGRKVFPQQIEAVLREHPAIAECVVYGVPQGTERGDWVMAAFVGKDIKPVEVESLRSWLSNKIPGWQIPRAFKQFETQLPTDARGKISRALLAAQHAARIGPTTAGA